MPAFSDIALDLRFPIIHSRRKDGANIIATRVPLDDIRLQKWGWILSLSYKDSQAGQDDIETLLDKSGRQYPKIYQLADIHGYIDIWECSDWNIGYDRGESEKYTRPLLQKDQEDSPRVEQVIEAANARLVQSLQDQSAQFYNRLLKQSTDTRQETINDLTQMRHHLDGQLQQLQETFVEQDILAQHEQSQMLLDKNEQGLHAIKQDLSQNLDLLQVHLLETIGDTNRTSTHLIEDTKTDLISQMSILQNMLQDRLKEQSTFAQDKSEEFSQLFSARLLAHFEAQSLEVKSVQDKVDQLVLFLNPEEEEDSTEENKAIEQASLNPSAMAKARRTTTQIERITKDYQTLITNFFNSSRDQANAAFKVVRFINSLGAITFVGIMILAFVMIFLKLYTYTVILGAIGGLGNVLVTVFGKLSENTQVKVAQQFSDSLGMLYRNYHPIVAQTMCINYSSEEKKQEALDKIIDHLLLLADGNTARPAPPSSSPSS